MVKMRFWGAVTLITLALGVVFALPTETAQGQDAGCGFVDLGRGPQAGTVAVSGNGQRIAYETVTGDLMVANSDGTGAAVVPRSFEDPDTNDTITGAVEFPSLSSDGSVLAVSWDSDLLPRDTIAVYDSNGGAFTNGSREFYDGIAPQIAAGGGHLLAALDTTFRSSVDAWVVYDLGAESNVTFPMAAERRSFTARLSGDGQLLAYQYSVSDLVSSEQWIAVVDVASETEIATFRGQTLFPFSMSDDGKIFFVNTTTNETSVWDSGSISPIGDGTTIGTSSGDGSKLVALGYNTDEFEPLLDSIVAYDAATGALTDSSPLEGFGAVTRRSVSADGGKVGFGIYKADPADGSGSGFRNFVWTPCGIAGTDPTPTPTDEPQPTATATPRPTSTPTTAPTSTPAPTPTPTPEPDPCGDLDLISCYAPEVRFHPQEQYFPMDPITFINGSVLMWVRGNQGGLLCAGDDPVNLDPSPFALGSGKYHAFQQDSKRFGCENIGRAFYTDEFTRPYSDAAANGVRAIQDTGSPLNNADGFSLEWKNTILDQPIGLEFDPGPGGQVQAPMFAQMGVNSAGERFITYHMFYGYDPKSQVDITAADPAILVQLVDGALAHEGDWERLIVVLDSDDKPKQFRFEGHGCKDDHFQGINWVSSENMSNSPNPPTSTGQGHFVDGTHPVIYVAEGSHASYPYLRDIGPRACGSGLEKSGNADSTEWKPGVSATWRPWEQGLLRDPQEQCWYGYGGAWGRGGSFALGRSHDTGPAGPHWNIEGLPVGSGCVVIEIDWASAEAATPDLGWGESSSVTVENAKPNTELIVSIASVERAVARGTTDANGDVLITFHIPLGFQPGAHRLIIREAATGEALSVTAINVVAPEECISDTASGSTAEDVDGDRVLDTCDAYLLDGPFADADQDGVLNQDDNCPRTANPDQEHGGRNRIGFACDADLGFVPTAALLADLAATCNGAEVTINMVLNGGDGTGTEGPDVILGTIGDDVIDGLGGDDIICAGDGNDTIKAGPGNDLVFASAGNDKIFGAQGADELHGGDGDDTIHGNRGNDTLFGDNGDDRIFGYAHNDTIEGGEGNDKLHGNFGDDIVNGGPGNDGVFGYGDNDQLTGGDGDDTIGGNFGNDTLSGGPGNDRLYGSDGTDTVNGGPGNDLVQGNSGNDTVNGGAGNDTLDGGINQDTCNGNSGTDTAIRCETTTGIP